MDRSALEAATDDQLMAEILRRPNLIQRIAGELAKLFALAHRLGLNEEANRERA